MRIKITFILLCFFSLKLFSQDTIVLISRGFYICKILETTDTEVKFQRLDTRKKEICIRKKKYIAYILHENGTLETYSEKGKMIADRRPKPKPTKVKQPKPPSPIDTPDYKKQRLSFSTNIYLLDKKEASLYVDYLYDYRHSVGLSIGYEYPNRILNLPLYYLYPYGPAPAYKGYVVRLNYKYYFTHSRKLYMSPQVMFKFLKYRNFGFGENDNHNGTRLLYRSEDATVLGFDIRFGYHISPVQSKFNMETFAGIGIRQRVRNYTDIGTERGDYYNRRYTPDGTSYHEKEVYPMIMVGFKIGVNAFFK